MAKAKTVTIIDGHTYMPNDELPDLGGLNCVRFNGLVREYEGISADIPHLPTYDDLATGSSFFAYDTTEVYKYYAPEKRWYKL